MLCDVRGYGCRKLDFASNFAGAFEGRDDEKDVWIDLPHFVSFLSDWLQSVIIKSTKENAVVEKRLGMMGNKGSVPAALNPKSWMALHWCLRSGYLQGVNIVSPGILKGITFVLSKVATEEQYLCRTQGCKAELKMSGRVLSETLANVLHILLAEYERSFRPNFDQWFSLALAALNIAQVIGLPNMVGLNDEVGPLHSVVLVVIEGFSRFVSWYPYPRTVFEAVVEKLLPSLLSALADLSSQVVGDISHQANHAHIWQSRYLMALQSLVRDGLFNSSHVGEFAEACVFLASQSSELVTKQAKPCGGQGSSYHRRLFEKLEQLRKAGSPVALPTMGFMLRAYAQKLKCLPAAAGQDVIDVPLKDVQLQTDGETTTPGNPEQDVAKGQINATKETAAVSMGPDMKARRQSEKLFAVFAEFTGPLMREFGELLHEATSENFEPVDMTISKALCLLDAVNSMLSAARDEHVHIPTEDTATNAHLGFLEYLQESVVKAAGLLAAFIVGKENRYMFFAPLMRQIVLFFGYTLDLDCRVAEEHVSGIWSILFMTSLMGHAQKDGNEDNVMGHTKNMGYENLPEVLVVACQIIQTYSDLRQVTILLFSLRI